jgi:hypothetical protein
MSDERPAGDERGHDVTETASAGRAGLAAQLQHLEAFVARSESAGEELPPEAVEMMTRLREIVRALDGLTASMGETDIAHAPDEDPAGP